MEIQGLGKFKIDEEYDWYTSDKIKVSFLNKECSFVFENYDEDESKDDFRKAVENFLSLDKTVLKEVEADIYKYYLDIINNSSFDIDEIPQIKKQKDIWKHIKFGEDVFVARRCYGDKKMYLSYECECDWEREHGLLLVFREGLKINKIGEFDGHVTNSDAYDNDDYENIVYVDYNMIII